MSKVFASIFSISACLIFLSASMNLAAQEPEASLIVVYDSHPTNQFAFGDTITVGYSVYIQGYWPGGPVADFLTVRKFRGAGNELRTIQTSYEYDTLPAGVVMFIAQKNISVTPDVDIDYVEGEVTVYQIVNTNSPGSPPQQALVELASIGAQGMYWMW